jgi:hypothetical protein
MGVLLVTALRALLYAVGVVANAAATLIVVRRLPVHDYALYQTVSKRVAQAAAMLTSLYAVWAYRLLAIGDPAASYTALLATSLVSAAAAAAGYATATALGADPLLAATAALAAAAVPFWSVARQLLDAARPVKAALAAAARRLLYSVFIVALVYYASLGTLGVFAAFAAATWAAVALAIYWLRGRGMLSRAPWGRVTRLLREWLRRSPVSALQVLAGVVASLDATVAYLLAGGSVVAAFFAATSLFFLLVDSTVYSLQHLQAHVLRSAEERKPLEATRLALALTAPFVGYTVTHPVHVAALVSPKYQWAALGFALAALAVPIRITEAGIVQLAAGLVEESPDAPRRLARIYAASLASSAFYIAALVPALIPASSPLAALAAWQLVFAARWLLQTLLVAKTLAPANRRDAMHLAAVAAGYTLLAALSSAPLSPPDGPRGSFLAQAAALAPWFTAAAAVYAALVALLDPWARGVARRALRLRSTLRGGRTGL